MHKDGQSEKSWKKVLTNLLVSAIISKPREAEATPARQTLGVPRSPKKVFEKSSKNLLTRASGYDIIIGSLRERKRTRKKLFEKSLKKVLTNGTRCGRMKLRHLDRKGRRRRAVLENWTTKEKVQSTKNVKKLTLKSVKNDLVQFL